MTCGIYRLNFKGTDSFYIGQSSCIEGRFMRHLNAFKKGTNSKKLQSAYSIYGIPTYEIVLECTVEELNDNEDAAIDVFDTVINGFNTLYKSSDTPYNIGIINGMSKFSEDQIISVMLLIINNLDMRYKEISDITGVSEQVIRNIASGTNHSWLGNSFPEEYNKLLSLIGSRQSRSNSKNAAGNIGLVVPAIMSPTGEIYRDITNVTQFAKKHNLHQSALGLVFKGKQKHHKGWKLLEVSTGVEPV